MILYDWRPSQIWYKIKCYLWHRYTTVKPRYLGHTWVDRDEVLSHIMFEILSEFIEKECSPGCIDWFTDDDHKIIRTQMQELYDWWHQVYNKQYEAICDRLWAHAEKHSPVTIWKNVENDWEEYAPTWETPSDEHLYKLCLQAVNNLETRMELDLEVNLHKIINLRPHMWT